MFDPTPRQMDVSLFKSKETAKPKAEKPPNPKKTDEPKNQTPTQTAKDLANSRGEPYIEILNIDVDDQDPGQGSFELDWNDVFVARLIKSGYQGKTDQDIVDNWFRAVCRNVLMETYEQEMADPEKRTNNRRNLGNGRTEIS